MGLNSGPRAYESLSYFEALGGCSGSCLLGAHRYLGLNIRAHEPMSHFPILRLLGAAKNRAHMFVAFDIKHNDPDLTQVVPI